LVLCLLVLYTVNAAPTGDDESEGTGISSAAGDQEESYKNVGRKVAALAPPTARRFGSSDTPTSIRCGTSCSQQFQQTMKNDKPQGAMLLEGDGEYNPIVLNVTCRAYDTAMTCLAGCDNGEFKTMMIRAMELPKFMCHDSTLKQNARCLFDAIKTTRSTCDARSKCGQYKEKIDEHTRSSTTTLADLTDLMKQQCNHFKCLLECGKPTVVSKCGQAAQNDWQGVYGKTVDSYKYVFELKDLSSAFPSECDRFIAAQSA